MINRIRSIVFATTESFLLRHSSLYTRRKSLLFLKVDSIGDYVLVRNFIECIDQSEKYRDYSITLCGNERCKDLAERLDARHVKRFIWIDYYRMYSNRMYRIKKHLQIYFSGFEVLIHPTFSRCAVSDDIVKHSGAKHKIGFAGDYANLPEADSKFNNKWYSQLININPETQFEFEKNREFFKQVLGDAPIARPSIPFNKAVEECVVICPGAKFGFRRWAPGNFAHLCDLIGDEYGGKFIIVGSSEDVPLADEIKRQSHQQFEDCTGKKNLGELIEIFSRARLIITNDSGPLHIAFAMNKNVIGISNGHHYQRFSPYPSYMNMNGTCVYPKHIDDLMPVSTKPDLLPDINTILPEEVYEIIAQRYLPKHEIAVNHNH
jgi:ADP-heptose:LPS heptosyltransferase